MRSIASGLPGCSETTAHPFPARKAPTSRVGLKQSPLLVHKTLSFLAKRHCLILKISQFGADFA
jgi:hypothetical protein